MSAPIEIWSGGQTGVDRAALDAARDLGLSTGGWVPLGRLAEDGRIPARYASLREAPSASYSVRTRLNVQDSDATLILRVGRATGGTLETLEAARALDRPFFEVDLATDQPATASRHVREWLLDLLRTKATIRLNVAGPRDSQAPLGYASAREVLLQALKDFAEI